MEAYGRLVGPPVFKTGERQSLSLAGSIPVRLRYLLRLPRPSLEQAPTWKDRTGDDWSTASDQPPDRFPAAESGEPWTGGTEPP